MSNNSVQYLVRELYELFDDQGKESAQDKLEALRIVYEDFKSFQRGYKTISEIDPQDYIEGLNKC